MILLSKKQSIAAALVGITFVVCSNSAHATITVDFTGQTGTAPTRSFSSGSVQLDFQPSADSPMTEVASSGQGLCLFASSSDGITRCGVGSSSEEEPAFYNLLEFTSNTPLFFTGGNVQQVFGTIFPTEVRFDINGITLATIPNSTGGFTFTTPVEIEAGQSIFLVGDGTLNSSIRVSSFTFEEVPGPLPLFGAAAAFGWSRKLRKKALNS